MLYIYGYILEYLFGHTLPLTCEKEFIKIIYIYQYRGYWSKIYQILSVFWLNRYQDKIGCRVQVPALSIKSGVHIIFFQDIIRLMLKHRLSSIYQMISIDKCRQKNKDFLLITLDKNLPKYSPLVSLTRDDNVGFDLRDETYFIKLDEFNCFGLDNLKDFKWDIRFYQKIYPRCPVIQRNILEELFLAHYKYSICKFIRKVSPELETFWVSIVFLGKYPYLELGSFREFKNKIVFEIEKLFKWYLSQKYSLHYQVFNRVIEDKLNNLVKGKMFGLERKLVKFLKSEKERHRWIIFSLI